MLELKALRLEDRNMIQGFLGSYPFGTYEYSFLTLYLWRKLCQTEIGIFQEALIIKKNEEKTGPYFMQPVGFSEENLPEIIAELMKVQADEPSMKTLFRDVEEPFLGILQNIYGSGLSYRADNDNFDYIYETEKLISLSGEKLGKRKNQYDQFAGSYAFAVRDIHEPAVAADCLAHSRRWLENQQVKYPEIVFELAGIEDVFRHMDQLDILGMAVYVQDKVAGFTIGEKVSDQMAVIHVEKADTEYKGIYAFINKTFAEKYLAETRYVNREEDQGIPGLRKAKRAYDPVKLEKKYMVNIAAR